MLPDAAAFAWFAFTFSSFLLFFSFADRNGCACSHRSTGNTWVLEIAWAGESKLINRRQWFYRVGLIASAAAAQSGSASLAAVEGVAKTERKPLDLSEYEPKNMLHMRESHVERARFAVIDFHTHISFSAKSAKGVELAPERRYLGTPQELLAVMDRKNIR